MCRTACLCQSLGLLVMVESAMFVFDMGFTDLRGLWLWRSGLGRMQHRHWQSWCVCGVYDPSPSSQSSRSRTWCSSLLGKPIARSDTQ